MALDSSRCAGIPGRPSKSLHVATARRVIEGQSDALPFHVVKLSEVRTRRITIWYRTPQRFGRGWASSFDVGYHIVDRPGFRLGRRRCRPTGVSWHAIAVHRIIAVVARSA